LVALITANYPKKTGMRRSTLQCWRDGKNIPGTDCLDKLYEIAGKNGIDIDFYVPPGNSGPVLISRKELSRLHRYERDLKTVRRVLK